MQYPKQCIPVGRRHKRNTVFWLVMARCMLFIVSTDSMGQLTWRPTGQKLNKSPLDRKIFFISVSLYEVNIFTKYVFVFFRSHLRFYISVNCKDSPNQNSRSLGWETGIGGRKGRVNRLEFRLGKQFMCCCLWCLGRAWCPTNVAWYIGYWK